MTLQYKPTKNQLRKWGEVGTPVAMPTDEEFKAQWAKSHGGKTRGWGMKKRDFILGNMTGTREYQEAIWQGRVDFLQGVDYNNDTDENPSAYNLGYYRGYTNCLSDLGGFDDGTILRMLSTYLNNVGQFDSKQSARITSFCNRVGLEVA